MSNNISILSAFICLPDNFLKLQLASANTHTYIHTPRDTQLDVQMAFDLVLKANKRLHTCSNTHTHTRRTCTHTHTHTHIEGWRDFVYSLIAHVAVFSRILCGVVGTHFSTFNASSGRGNPRVLSQLANLWSLFRSLTFYCTIVHYSLLLELFLICVHVRLSLCLSVSACVCYILWQLPICALSMEHFPHNWVFPSGPQARFERHDGTRKECVVCGTEFAGFTWRAACSHLDCQPTKHWLDAVLCCGPGCPLDAKQSTLSLTLHLSLALFFYRTLSVFWQLPGRASSSA